MFARSVSMRLKPNSTVTFNNTLENEVLPLLRAQKGFRDEVVLVAQDGTEVVGISLWDDRESADSYHKERYPEVQQLLSKAIQGTAQVKTYEVPISSFHKVTAGSRRQD